ncbi:MAG: tRNA (adenosine(37)-N6)-dimethylallyltransferase MiaA [Nannocystaceae bacterium]|nr:tRNA (adenosine(37)-N6)-dimethylallyltransferase MiaA [Nannocystaceae bacterium]
MSPPRALAVVGPTAAGKGALARTIATTLGRALLVCDSVKVYRGLDIGTGKPDAGVRAGIEHHLLDLVDPDQGFSAGDYADAAWPTFSRTRGIFVGGTGFYLRQLAWSSSEPDDGGVDAPREHPERAAFEARWHAAQADEPGAPWRALQQRDPDTAATIHPANVVRVVRALWLCHAHGRPVAAVRAAAPPTPRLSLMLVLLDPGPEALARRIERRLDAMLAAGFLDEVERLLASGYHGGHKAMQSLGYRQLLDVVAGRTDLASARADILTATRQLAKRQRTYFRHQFPGAIVHAIASPEACPWHAIEEFLDAAPRRGVGP